MNEDICVNFICSALKKADIENKGIIFDNVNSDLDRLYFILGNEEYDIRMWNIGINGEVDYTLFRLVENHGEEVDKGTYYLPLA